VAAFVTGEDQSVIICKDTAMRPAAASHAEAAPASPVFSSRPSVAGLKRPRPRCPFGGHRIDRAFVWPSGVRISEDLGSCSGGRREPKPPCSRSRESLGAPIVILEGLPNSTNISTIG
jgi:hypothetical protein